MAASTFEIALYPNQPFVWLDRDLKGGNFSLEVSVFEQRFAFSVAELKAIEPLKTVVNSNQSQVIDRQRLLLVRL